MLDPNTMHIEVSKDAIAAMTAAAKKEYPCEACGILLGEGNRISAFRQARNVHPKPETHFEIDPQTLIDAHRNARRGGPQVIGYFHSHPIGKPHPSTTDRQMSSGDRSIWVIQGEGGMTFSRDEAEDFQLLSYKIVDE